MTAYQHLLELAADRVRRRGPTKSELLCPAHEDRTPSLSLSAGRDENAVIHCHAGCPAADVMAAWPGGTLPVAALYDAYWNRDRELEATYDYLDEAGRLLFQVVRKPGKQFRQRRPDGAGGWVWNLKSTRRVLYRLPRVLEAVAAGATVYVCEGEKDVHALEGAGVTATCNPGGAGKWRDEYAQALEGARVVVIRDRDDAGRRHADVVVASLRGQGMFRRAAARSVRLVEAATGKDAADHLAAGKTVEQLVDVEPGDAPAPTLARKAARPAGDLTLPVVEAIGAYQVLEDTDPIRAALGVAATVDLDGEPVWLQQVGGPSSGKSEAISMLADAADGRIGELTVGGLLGWAGGKNGRPTGLLPRIGDGSRLATISDFSTVLGDQDRGRRAQLFGLLRTLYDGHVIRDIFGPPAALEWAGRLTIVSAVTPAIDAYSSHADALGPRWLYIRIPELSRRGRKRAAELAREHGGRKQELRQIAREHAARAVTIGRSRAADVEVGPVDGDQIEDAAIIATLARSAVPREGYHQEVVGVVTREEPFRMITVLVLLYRGLVAVGVTPRTARRIAMRCATDSIPLARRQALDALAAGEVLTTSDVARRMNADYRVAKIALEDLELLGIARGQRRGTTEDDDETDARNDRRAIDWRLDGDDGKLAARVLSAVSRSVESTHTSPPNTEGTPYESANPERAEQTGAAEGR